MTRGLPWLPLLAVFCWLAWAGWNEFQKLEAYRSWASQFDHAKYDIYAVLGQKGSELTWGKPSRRGPLNLQTFSLHQVKAIQLRIDNQVVDPTVDLNAVPTGKTIALEFQLADAETMVVPFTDGSLAAQWANHLQADWQTLRQPQA
ncbi:hypothetical protein HJG54_14480 [Leptolyngbya sp. NK1-12]|uniref:Uncharacterized protein n=1 Tax=Leptolyngbya sp. NK1-12 TaxID=2547451 RepID=A0AA97AKU7_9CYAN|nr:hypothetical protein [Leptolyngbya sp. NK1-12]WNZ23942.1 hypothetical protein HJG54_14480 [Leptolyngbya sp. NK1-12]